MADSDEDYSLQGRDFESHEVDFPKKLVRKKVVIKDANDNEVNPATSNNQTNGTQKTQVVGADGTVSFIVNDKTVLNNSTTTPLLGNGTFVGATMDTLGYGSINYSFIADQPTVANGLYVEFSDDGTNWDKRIVNTYEISHINSVTDLSIRCHSRYARLGVINGASAQTYIRLYTVLKEVSPSGDTMGVDHVPISGDDALLVKAVIAGKTTVGGGSYVDVKVNPSGALTTDDTIKNIAGAQINPATFENQQPPVTTPTVYNVTLTLANTEYSQALPANTREIRFTCRTIYDVRYAWLTGKVATPTAPYLTLPAGMEYASDNDNLTAQTLYLASSQAGVVVEIEVWT